MNGGPVAVSVERMRFTRNGTYVRLSHPPSILWHVVPGRRISRGPRDMSHWLVFSNHYSDAAILDILRSLPLIDPSVALFDDDTSMALTSATVKLKSVGTHEHRYGRRPRWRPRGSTNGEYVERIEIQKKKAKVRWIPHTAGEPRKHISMQKSRTNISKLNSEGARIVTTVRRMFRQWCAVKRKTKKSTGWSMLSTATQTSESP